MANNNNPSEHNIDSQDVILYAVADGIANITMNRPAYRNAQNSAMTYAMDAAFKRAVADDEVKVIILRGAGKHFSAGHDLGTCLLYTSPSPRDRG